MLPLITYDKALNYSYEDLAVLVKEHREIKIETALAGYNPMFGLVKLRLKPEPGGAPAKYFGDNDDNYPNSVHKLYIEDMDQGTKKLTAEQNRFVFTIVEADRSNPCYDSPYGANHHGLGIKHLEKPQLTLASLTPIQRTIVITIILVLILLAYKCN